MTPSDARQSDRPPIIHIVDDDASVLRSMGRLMASLGLVSRGFSSAAELLADPHGLEADSFILDVHMPGMSGYELARRLAEAGSDSPVVFISAYPNEMHEWGSKAPSGISLLLKPFSEEQLLCALDKALGARLSVPPR